jgi:hypothetical protein
MLASVLSQRMFLNMRMSAEASAQQMMSSHRDGGLGSQQRSALPTYGYSRTFIAGAVYEGDRKSVLIPMKTLSPRQKLQTV